MKRTFAILFGGAALLLLVMIGLGQLDVHFLAHSRFGRADGSVDSTLAHHRDHLLNSLTLAATFIASTLPVVVLAAVVVAVTAVVFKRWREPLFVVATVVGEVTIFVVTTLAVHRSRPNVVRLDHAPPTSSFPSGHTAAAVALYGAIAALVVVFGARIAWRRVAVTAAILMPILVAASRLYRGMHYPTDVLAGALLGFCWLRVATYAVFGGLSSGSRSHAREAPHAPETTAEPPVPLALGRQ